VLDTSLLITAIALLLAVNTAGVALTAFQLPGNWLTSAACGVFAWLRWGDASWSLGVPAVATVLGLAVLGELLEFVTGALGSASAGGSKRGSVLSIPAALAGAIAGSLLIPVPVLGTLAGAAAGGGLGALAGDKWAGRPWGQAFRTAGGAAVGKVTGTVLKLAVGVAQWIVAALALVL